MIPFYKTHFILLCLLCLAGITNVKAQEKNTPISAEDVAIAFYKTGNLVPNFEKWIKETDPYKHTALGRRDKVMEEEKYRLKKAYQDFDPKNNLLTIKTTAIIKAVEKTNETGQINHFVQIIIDKDNDVSYFPYRFMKQNIMVIPHAFEEYTEQEISKNQYDHIKSMTKKDNRHPLTLILKAEKADFDHPYMVDETPQWAFLTQIAVIESWSKEGVLIWEYSAPWYLSPNQNKIKNLYKKPDGLLLDHGYVKPIGNIK